VPACVRAAGYTDPMRTDRTETFSDGVFAIAITLLVLEIKAPTGSTDLWHDLGELWPSYAAFVVSFFTIGVIWVNHHSQFERFVRADRRLLFLNLLLLFWVAFIPFPTSVVATQFREGTFENVATAVYSGTFLAMGFSFFALWTYARRAGLIDESVTPELLRALTFRNLLGEVGYAIAVGLAFVNAPASLILDGLIAVYYVHPGRAARRAARPRDA
jgi:uncharacterized membrane protein